MSSCNTPMPQDLSLEEKEKWKAGCRIMAEALEKLDDLGLAIHTAYHKDFFMLFKDSGWRTK